MGACLATLVAPLLGISWGGALAQQFALSRPGRVRRLVLVATGTGSVMVPGWPRVLRHLLTPRRHRDPGCAVSIAGEIYGGSTRTSPARSAAANCTSTAAGTST